VPWQQAVLGKRIVGVDGIDDIPIGLILLEDGTALSLGMDMAGRDKYHFEFWPRQKQPNTTRRRWPSTPGMLPWRSRTSSGSSPWSPG